MDVDVVVGVDLINFCVGGRTLANLETAFYGIPPQAIYLSIVILSDIYSSLSSHYLGVACI